MAATAWETPLRSRAPALPPRLTVISPRDPAEPEPAALRVSLVSEGTYPFAWGGVSTWCDTLVRAMPEVQFDVVAIAPRPGTRVLFDLPANVASSRTIPLWGVRDVKEVSASTRLLALDRARRRVTDDAVADELVPALRAFVRALFDGDGAGASATNGAAGALELGRHAHAMHRFFLEHDFHLSMRSEPVWRTCVEELSAGYASHEAGDGGTVSLREVTKAYHWLYGWLSPLAEPLPEVDVVHAAMAGVCSLVCVVTKIEHGAGFLLTEHGVYLRERYLAAADLRGSRFLKVLSLGFARRMTEMGYVWADQISPCCDYNQRWELEVGAVPEQLETIYYGLEEPAAVAAADGDAADALPDCVVWVGRINPLKDVETLLRAAAAVVAARPDVTFRLYGGAPAEDAEYHARCLRLHAELGLEGSVEFCGYTSNPMAAYSEGDVVVLSSVSEGFPYSTLEAMLCARPIVATRVGGIPEQIKGAGTVVEPRDPEAMAEALLELLSDGARCRALGTAARQRATQLFGQNRFRAAHLATYLRLSPRHAKWSGPRIPLRRDSDAAAALPTGTPTRSLDELAAQVASAVSAPVDGLEVAAVLESVGVSDSTSRDVYGYPSTFALAAALYRRGTAARAGGDADAAEGDTPHRVTSRLDSARFPALAMLAPIGLLAAIAFVTKSGGWSLTRVLTLSLGMTAGMLACNGTATAMGRRAATLISLAQPRAARRYVDGAIIVGAVLSGLVATAVLQLDWGPTAFLAREPVLFVTAAVVMSVVWLLSAAMSLVSQAGWGGLAILGGTGSLVLVDRLVALFSSWHLLVAGVVASAVTVALLLNRWYAALRAVDEPHGEQTDPVLPRVSYAVVESVAYFSYGSLGVLLFISVHLVGWAAVGGIGPAFVTLELGLFLPLAPTVLGAGVAERSLRAFWRDAAALQQMPVESRDEFPNALVALRRRELRRYMRSLGLTASATTLLVVLVTVTGSLDDISGHGTSEELLLLYGSGLVAYSLIGIAQFNGMFALSLGAPSGLVAVLCLSIVVTVWGAVLMVALLGYAAAGIGLAAGAAIYAMLTSDIARRLLADADFYYATAV